MRRFGDCMKLVKSSLVILLLICMTSSVFAADAFPSRSKDDISVIFNGTEIESKIPAQIINGTLMVPMRKYFEILGANVKWIDSTREVVGYKNNTFIKLKIDSNEAYNNGKKFKLKSAPAIVAGVTLVPVDFVAETFNMSYKFDETKNILTLLNKENSQKFNYVKDGYFKRVPFDSLGIYISVPQFWEKDPESNSRYGYSDESVSVSVDVTSAKLANGKTAQDYINDLKLKELDKYSSAITFTGSYNEVINGIDAVVLTSIIKNEKKEVRYILEEESTIYIIDFNYSIDTPDEDIIDTIGIIAKSFQISKFTVNYQDEHYIEYDSYFASDVKIDQEIYSNMEIKGVMKFSGSVDPNSPVKSLKIKVSRDSKSKVFTIPVVNGMFDGNIYAPFGLGKHNVTIESILMTNEDIVKKKDSLAESIAAAKSDEESSGSQSGSTGNKGEESTESTKNEILMSQFKNFSVDSTKQNLKKALVSNPKILEFSFINLEIDKLEYLIPSEKVQKDHIEITSLSNLLTYNKFRKFDKAKGLFTWVADNISLKQTQGNEEPKTSIKVFEDEYGNGLEINILYVALLRSIDIPSRVVMGTTIEQSKYYYTEMYINGIWEASDPVAAIRYLKAENSKDASQYFITNLDEYKQNFDKVEIANY